MKRSLGALLQLTIGIAVVCAPAFAGALPPAPVPEPATIALLGTGVAAVIGIRYLRNRKR